MSQFDAKIFNGEVFGKYVERIPNTKRKELIRSGVLNTRTDLKSMLVDQTGGNYITVPFKGLLDGTPVNYDGNTNITATSTKTYSQSMIVVGRAKAWTEKDFSQDITGVNFMDNVAQQVNEYWMDVDQATLLAILKGIYAMSDAAGLAFAAKHTKDITNADVSEDPDARKAGAVSLNEAIQKACGDNKQIFALAIMHSVVSTRLENLRVLEYLKYTDADGIVRDLTIAAWNGKIIFIDDNMPTSTTVTTAGVYSLTLSTAATAGDKIVIGGREYEFVANDATPEGNQIKVGAAGTAAQQATNIATFLNAESTGLKDAFTIAASSSKVTFTNKVLTQESAIPYMEAKKAAAGTLVIAAATDTPEVVATNYTTYILGKGAFEYCDCGAKVPYEMDRNPAANGGEDTLYTRQRKLFAPKGISFTKASMSSLSPTDAELELGANWELVNDGAVSKTYINDKAIPIARLISRG